MRTLWTAQNISEDWGIDYAKYYWAKLMIYERCERFDTRCRFASIEITYSPYTAVKLQDRHYVPIKQGYKKNVLGTRCNNAGDKMTDEITQCPARLGLVQWCGVKAPGTGIYAKLHTETEMRIAMREIIPGQQVLCV